MGSGSRKQVAAVENDLKLLQISMKTDVGD
jgi:hypothetical protein